MNREQILVDALNFLLEVKSHKDTAGKDAWYNSNQPRAWKQATEALALYHQASKGHQSDKGGEWIDEDIDKVECLIGYVEAWLKHEKPPEELPKVIDEAKQWVNAKSLSSPPKIKL